MDRAGGVTINYVYIRPMKVFLTLLFILFFLSSTHAQSGSVVADDIKELLPPGKFLAKSFLPALPELTPREKELQSKITKAAMEHASWFRDSMKGMDDVDKMMEKLGLTPAELEEFGKLSAKTSSSIRITGSDSLEILRSGNIISFKGHGVSKPLDSLQINLDANNAVFRGQVIPFKRSSPKNSDQDPFKTSKGYEYSYEPPSDATAGPMHAIDNLVNFSLYVGSMQTTGETVLILLVLKNVDRRTVLNINVPLLFK